MTHFNSRIQDGLFFFADVIESSKYSSVLGTESYVNNVLLFQHLFSKLAMSYFKDECSRFSDSFCQIRNYGDEGAIFFISPSVDPEDQIYQAIKFAFELKARMEVEFHYSSEDHAPQKMELGIGLHYGPVALIEKGIVMLT